jgi:hypothetical protein
VWWLGKGVRAMYLLLYVASGTWVRGACVSVLACCSWLSLCWCSYAESGVCGLCWACLWSCWCSITAAPRAGQLPANRVCFGVVVTSSLAAQPCCAPGAPFAPPFLERVLSVLLGVWLVHAPCCPCGPCCGHSAQTCSCVLA